MLSNPFKGLFHSSSHRSPSRSEPGIFMKMWNGLVGSPSVAEKQVNGNGITLLNPTEKTGKMVLKARTAPDRDPGFGAESIVKTFYEGRGSRNGCYNWVDSPPRQLNKKVAKAHDRAAIKVYKIKDHSKPTVSGRTPLTIFKIEIQSLVLLDALKDILEQEHVFVPEGETASFERPFKPLFFCYDRILTLYENVDGDDIPKQHLGLLMQVLDDIFSGLMTQLKHFRANGLISYRLAWTFFPRNSILYSGRGGCEQLSKVLDTNYREEPVPHMVVKCQEIAFDGESFVWKTVERAIQCFKGNLPIANLSHIPFQFHADQEGLKEKLVLRGTEVLNYQQLTYCEYSGIGLKPNECRVEKHNVRNKSGQVLSLLTRWIRCPAAF